MSFEAQPRPVLARRSARGAVALLALMFLGWLSFPLWAPALLERQLPDGWQVLQAEVGWPGPRSLRVGQLTVSGAVSGISVEVASKDLLITYPGLSIRAEAISLGLEIGPGVATPAREEVQSPLADRVSLPRIIPPGGLPRVEIGRFEWRITGPSGQQTGSLSELVFGQDAGITRLESSFDRLPVLTVPGTLDASLSGDVLEFSLTTAEPVPRRVLYLRQGMQPSLPGQESLVTATLNLDLDLGLLAPGAVDAWLGPVGLGPVDHLGGRLAAGAQFQGARRLRPVAASLLLEGVEVGLLGARLALDWAVNAGLSGSRVVFNQEKLALEANLPADLWESTLAPMVAASGVRMPETEGETFFGLQAVGGWTGYLDWEEPVLLTWSGDLEAAGRRDGAQILLTANDARYAGGFSGRPEFVADVTSDVRLPGAWGLDQESVHAIFQDFEARITGQVDLGGAGATIADGIEFAVGLGGQGLMMAEPGLGAGEVKLESGVFSGQLQTGANGLQGDLRFDGARLPAAGLSMDVLELRIEELTLPGLDGRVGILTTGLQLPLPGASPGGVDLDVVSQVAGAALVSGQGELLLGLAGSLPVRFRIEPLTGNLVIELVDAGMPAPALAPLLRGLAAPLPAQARLTGGQLSLDGEITIAASGEARGAVGVDAGGMGLMFGETRVEALNFSGRLGLAEAVSVAGQLDVGAIELAAGLDVSALSVAIDARGPEEIRLSGLNARLLDGDLGIEEVVIAAGLAENTTITLRNFDLGRLLAFFEVSGLEGAGRLEASLPLHTTVDGLTIEDGTFHALGPGRLRYSTGLPAANVGMQALENFVYESLDGNVAYGEDGHYTVNIRLLGKNPDLYGGHPIHFQLNLGGDMPALFRSLFVTGDFDRAILEELSSRSSKLDGDGSN